MLGGDVFKSMLELVGKKKQDTDNVFFCSLGFLLYQSLFLENG